jgi:hypothetical protein
MGMTPDEFLNVCQQEELEGLIYHRLGAPAIRKAWPADLCERLAAAVRLQAACELARCDEIRRVVDALFDQAIEPIVLKGAALAYSVYPSPVSRPRSDTDLLIRADAVDAARIVMADLGYCATVHCNELFHQFEVQKEDQLGVLHAFDIHWSISTQPVFAGVLTYDELRARSQPVPALGPHARGAGTCDALLLGCVHPVMHHRNVQRLLWIHDIHLLASQLTPGDFEFFAESARQKQMAAVCARALQAARDTLGTVIPDSVFEVLTAAPAGEPSAEYLRPNRRWHHELASSVRSLATPRERVRLLRDVLFPSPRYMRGAYGVDQGLLGSLLLPALYVHRNVFGAWKLLSGKK